VDFTVGGGRCAAGSDEALRELLGPRLAFADARAVCGVLHLWQAAELAQRAHDGGYALSHSRASEVLLYRPLPGTASGEHAERNGYEMPLSFDTWGGMVEYKFENKTYESLPADIKRDYHRYTYLVPWFDGLVKGNTPYHRFLKWMAGYRLRNHMYAWALEHSTHVSGG